VIYICLQIIIIIIIIIMLGLPKVGNRKLLQVHYVQSLEEVVQNMFYKTKVRNLLLEVSGVDYVSIRVQQMDRIATFIKCHVLLSCLGFPTNVNETQFSFDPFWSWRSRVVPSRCLPTT